jgi:phospholipid/cholesterol/gamma-HCH transport system permease protein
MRALGVDPIRKLMTPRVLATVFVLPLLVGIADFLGLLGGFLISYFTLRVSGVQFWTRAVDALVLGDLVMGIVAKPTVYAIIVSTIGCYQGLRVRGGTQGVGRATTSAVVISSLAVLVVDLFLTKLFLHIFNLA